MHTSVQITALQQLLKELWLKAQKVGLVFKVADVFLWHRWAVPQPSPPQHRTSLCVTAGQQPQSHLTGQEDSQHIPTLSPTLSTNREVFLLKPLQTRAAPHSLILDFCSKSSSSLLSMWCESVVEFQLWHVSCARALHMLLGLLLCSCSRTDDTRSHPVSARTKLPYQNILNKFEAALWTCTSSALGDVWLQLLQLITGSCRTILTFFERLFNYLEKQTIWCWVSCVKTQNMMFPL